MSVRLSLGATRGAAGPPAADREPAARVDRRRARHPGRLLGPAAAARRRRARRRRSTGACSRSCWRSPSSPASCSASRRRCARTGVNVSAALKETQPQRRRLAQPARARRCSSCRSRSRSCCWSAPGCSCGRCTTCGSVDVGFNPQNLVLFRVNPQLNRYDEKRTTALYDELARAPRRRARRARRRRCRNPALLSGSVNSTSIFVQGRTYAGLRRRDNSINRLRRLAELLRDDGDPDRARAAASPIATTTTAPKVVGHQRSGGAEVLSRTRIRSASASARARRRPDEIEDRRRAARREVQQRARCGAADDVRAVSCRRGWAAPCSRCGPPAIPRAVIGAIREAVRQIDPNLPMMDVSTQIEQVEQRFQQERVFAQAYTLFGGAGAARSRRSASSA